MPKRRVRLRRSTAEWAVRGTLAIAAVGLGYTSAAQSLAYMIRGSAPDVAHMLFPWDGRVTALFAEKLSGPGASALDRKRADELARLALQQDPTVVSAVATLGINEQIRGNTIKARRIFAYSTMLSRRDLRTQLWAIEDAVGREDILGALRTYDNALRTSRTAPDLLFPVLASAITDDKIREGLVTILLNRPVWSNQFLGFISGNGPDTLATAGLFEDLNAKNITTPPGSQANLIGRLLSKGYIDSAWHLYASITPGANRRFTRDPNFAANPSPPTPFDWQPVTDSGIAATIQRSKQGGIFDFTVPSNLGGPVLRQTQLLVPGDYTIEGRSIGIEQVDSALPYWALTCVDGRELGRVTIPNSIRAQGHFVGRFTVPAGCSVQQLEMVARPSEALSGLTGQIEYVRLQPFRN